MPAGGYATEGARHSMTHPVLDMQRALNGSNVDLDSGGGFFSELGIDSTPNFVAALVLGSAILLLLLKRAGFRFNFGVGANIGR